jgi:DNA-binding response OmpR family regulator
MRGNVCHILAVEDNSDTGQLLAVIFESQGYSVTCVPTIKEAEELMMKRAFDLYLLDTRLPDGDGVELCKEIRKGDRQTPILFFSAAAFEKDKIRAIEAGADGYIIKPTDPILLIEQVSWLLKSKNHKPS